MLKKIIVLILISVLFSQFVFADSAAATRKQIIALEKRITELKLEIEQAEKDYDESLSTSFDNYMKTVRGEDGKKITGKVHVMRKKMDFEEEKLGIKKRLQKLKEELKSSETKLLVLKS